MIIPWAPSNTLQPCSVTTGGSREKLLGASHIWNNYSGGHA